MHSAFQRRATFFSFRFTGLTGTRAKSKSLRPTKSNAARPAAAAYVPNDLFFNPGSDQYFTDWSLSYLQEHFYPDTWLIKQSPTTAQIVRAEVNSPAPPEGMLGALMVKKRNGQ